MFSHIAGDALLDLVKTVHWRLSGERRSDDLGTFARVVLWCAESGLLDDEEEATLGRLAHEDPTTAERERSAVVELREHLYRALFADDDAAASAIADAYRQAAARSALVATHPGWAWSTGPVDLRTPRHRIALRLLDLLRRDDLDRLHQCEDAACGWVYLDTSPRRNRRWCVTSDCGDRNRARAYYARRRATGSMSAETSTAAAD